MNNGKDKPYNTLPLISFSVKLPFNHGVYLTTRFKIALLSQSLYCAPSRHSETQTLTWFNLLLISYIEVSALLYWCLNLQLALNSTQGHKVCTNRCNIERRDRKPLPIHQEDSPKQHKWQASCLTPWFTWQYYQRPTPQQTHYLNYILIMRW